MSAFLAARGPYLLYAGLIGLGVFLILTHRNLFKSLVGVAMIQSGIILFFILLSFRHGATIPILQRGDGPPLANPLPHALMLTAIVVGVATLGLGISILLRLQAEEGSIEEPAPPGGGGP